jgi:transposase InsO family protein
VIEAIADQATSVTQICETLTVSRSAFYSWQQSAMTSHEQRDEELLPLIRIIFRKHKRRYGARRIAHELRDMGHRCSVRRVRKLLSLQGLKAIQPKSFQPKTTNSKHRLGYSPNLLLDAADPDRINQLWVGDITYVRLRGGVFAYLAMLMDRFSRRIIGWNLGTDMTESLVLKTLRQAIRERRLLEGMIHHSDRGGQYAGNRYRAILRRANIGQSMSRAADCYDNAFMESCFGTLKRELEMIQYDSHRAAQNEINEYVRYYNFERKHSSLEYLKPAQFESLINQPK